MEDNSLFSVGDIVKLNGGGNMNFYTQISRVRDYPEEIPRYYYDIMYRIEKTGNGAFKLIKGSGYVLYDMAETRFQAVSEEEKIEILIALGLMSEGDESVKEYLVGNRIL